MEPWSLEWKQKRYEELWSEWENCQRCPLHEMRKQVVFGDGNLNADIMFIGEAPGQKEDGTGECFVGDSGQLLRTMCATVGIDIAEQFVTNVVACRPPDNRDPIAVEKDACVPRLYELIYLVDPLVIVPVGKFALNILAGGRSWGIEAEHGKLFSTPHPSIKVAGERNGAEIPGRVFPRKGADKKVYNLEYDLVPIFHPSYILRVDSYDREKDEFSSGGVAHQTLEDLEAVVKRVEQLKQEYSVIPRMIERM